MLYIVVFCISRESRVSDRDGLSVLSISIGLDNGFARQCQPDLDTKAMVYYMYSTVSTVPHNLSFVIWSVIGAVMLIPIWHYTPIGEGFKCAMEWVGLFRIFRE